MSCREDKLKIAKLVYSEIMNVINAFENRKDYEIKCCWDEFIWVDDECFSGYELK